MTLGDTPLTADDPLPHRPRRVLVTGCSGSGKTTLAAALAVRLGIPHQELDALFHGSGWVPRPTFVAEVTALAADLLVWLDLARARVFTQLLSRTVVRRVRRVELWNGNHEPPLHTIFTDPEHVVRWAWGSYVRIRPRVQDVLAQPDHPVVVRLRSRREIRRWLAQLA